VDLRSEINAIKIIDHHAHVMDPFYWNDALGEASPFPPLCDLPGPDTHLAKTSKLLLMFRELFGFSDSVVTEENAAHLREAYDAATADEAALYHRVMDLAGIETVGILAQSRPILPPQLDPKRFRVISLADGLIIPLDNSALKKPVAKCETFIKMAEVSAEILKNDLAWHPTTFDDYLRFVSAAVERLKDKGAIALKSSCGYWRGLDFEVVDEDEARVIFDAKDSSPAHYKRLQDFLQIKVLQECGRVGLPFHMHTGAGGQEGFMGGSNPSLLDKLVWHADTKCTIVLLHGGFPYCGEAGFMVAGFGRRPRPLYLDTSLMWMDNPTPGALSHKHVLREWLEWGIAPQMIYGSDAPSPFRLWLSALSFREDLCAVLSDMVTESLLTEDQALTAAYQILRGNSEKIYNWQA
jgi:uncharacterized protein